jgi:PAS domain S-box-containing protein
MIDPIRVLILEDRNDDAEIMVLALEDDGFEVAWERVETPDSLIAHLTPDVDVILADYTLPQFTASDALVLLQKRAIDIPLIVVTGSVSEKIAVACIKHGATDYLLKDRLSRLGEAVRFAIRQRDLRRAQRQAELDLIVLRQAVESSINAVVMTDMQGRIVFANHAVMSLWAIPPHQTIVGEPLLNYLGHSVESNALFTRLQHETTLQGELLSVTQENHALTLQYAANQVPDSSGQFRNLLFIFVDITEQKRAERLRVELERERELRELRSRFVSMLVHDFRNPLTA